MVEYSHHSVRIGWLCVVGYTFLLLPHESNQYVRRCVVTLLHATSLVPVRTRIYALHIHRLARPRHRLGSLSQAPPRDLSYVAYTQCFMAYGEGCMTGAGRRRKGNSVDTHVLKAWARRGM